MSNNNVYLIIFLAVVLILNAFIAVALSKDRKQEDFVVLANDALELNVFKHLGRNIVFPYLGTNTINTAAQRALNDLSLSSKPAGKCAINEPHGEFNDSLSVVHEDGIFYSLNKSCLALATKKGRNKLDRSYRFGSTTNTLIIDFDISTNENLENFAKFVLVNPLFVEFNFASSASVAYIPDFGTNFVLSNAHHHRGVVSVTFDVAVPTAKGQCDPAFNYAKLSKNQTKVTEAQMNSITNNNNLINIMVYYTSELCSNFQKTGRSLPTAQTDGASLTIFDKGYADISKDLYKVDTYEFMNRFSSFYYNFIAPVLTFSFDMAVDKKNILRDKPYEILNCSMKNGYLGGGAEKCANNMLSVGVKNSGQKNSYMLAVGVGNHKECGYGNWEKSPPLSITLPYLSPGTTMRITVTVGHNQKHLFAQWTDIHNNDRGKKFAYAKSIKPLSNKPYNSCSIPPQSIKANLNNFTRMFSKKEVKGEGKYQRPALENTYLTWDQDYVKKIRNVSFGYPNFSQI